MKIEDFDLEDIIKTVEGVNDNTVPVDKILLLSILNAIKELKDIKNSNVKIEELFNAEEYTTVRSSGLEVISMGRLVSMDNRPPEVLVNSIELIGLYKDNRTHKKTIERYEKSMENLNKNLNAVKSVVGKENPYVSKGYLKVNSLA